jgi:SAM-dependent methyltransferase
MKAGAYRTRIKRAGLAAYWLRTELVRFRGRIPDGGLVVDIGSGDSPYRDLWKSSRYISIDYSDPAADVIGDALRLPVRTECAGLAVCTEVLEHVFDTGAALAELHRILKPGGCLLLSTPLVMGRHESRDFYRFTPECLERHIAAAGFRQIEIRPRGGIFSSIGVLLTHIPEQIRPRRVGTRSSSATGRNPAGFLGRLWFMYAMAFQKAIRILAWLDRFDARKDFTLGYLAFSKKENSPAGGRPAEMDTDGVLR